MRGFSIGGVIDRALALLRADLGRLLVLALLQGVVPQLALALVAAVRTGPGLAWWASGANIFDFIWGTALQVLMLRTALGRGMGGLSFARFPIGRMIGLSLFTTFATLLAGILLVFPAFMLACRWVAAAPAVVAEDVSFSASLGRSAALTEGRRWPIFALFLIEAALLGVTLAVSYYTRRYTLALGWAAPTRWRGRGLVAVVGGASSLLINLGVAATYLDLRAGREGEAAGELAELFR